jgi:uncharacterized protein (DUF427 family)
MTDRGRVRVEPGQKRVRIMLGGECVADTTRPLLVWEKPYYPTYYIPLEDVTDGVLVGSSETRRSPSRGEAAVFDVKVAHATAAAAAYRHTESPIEAIRDHVAFDWKAMDQWFEEDVEVFVHPRDPYTRVDVLGSSRTVRIEIDGTVLAETSGPTALFETGLPRRWYVPKTHVRLDLLTPTATATECPYKGTARYWSYGEHTDIVWSYPFPAAEVAGIAGLMAFYDEKVDVYVDGELQERQRTQFS